MENTLRNAFDYQKFEHNNHLDSLIEETRERYKGELSMDELDNVCAGKIDNINHSESAKIYLCEYCGKEFTIYNDYKEHPCKARRK